MEEKYKILVNYLKILIEKNTVYIDLDKIQLILEALEEVE